MRVRLSSVLLVLLGATWLCLLLVFRDALVAAHADESIHYLASDAATYYAAYRDFYQHLALEESRVLFLVGSPVLFMKLADGELLFVQAWNLSLMAISLAMALNCLPSFRTRMAFMVGALAFPYFTLGFLSLNKEIYAVCAAILYGCYMLRGYRRYLLLALAMAACARYYMLLALLVMVVVVPRDGLVRWGALLAILAAISLVAPVAKTIIPEYSSEDLLGEGFTALLFASLIDNYAYLVVYPLKYVALIPLRAYSVLIGSERAGDPMEAVVSVMSLLLVTLAVVVALQRKRASPIVLRLVTLGFVAPAPIMWTEIMHWRYFSFVYFFFLFAVVLHFLGREMPSARGRLVHA